MIRHIRASVLILLSLAILGTIGPGWAFDPQFSRHFPTTVQISYDPVGVPHVVASSPAGVFWGFGYSLGRSRLYQMEILRRSVQGTLAEILGESYLDADLLARRDGVSRTELAEGLERAPTEFRVALGAFTAGLNAAVMAVQNRRLSRDPGFAAVGLQPSSFSEMDVLEIFSGTMAARYNDFTSELDNLHLLSSLVRSHGARQASQIFEDVVFYEDPKVYTTMQTPSPLPPQLRHLPDTLPGYTPALPLQSPSLRNRKRNELLQKLGIPQKSGSYAVALSMPARGGKGAVLFGGPQMGNFKPSAVFEIGLHCPQFDLVGTTPVGYFMLLFGANRHLAFTATAGCANLVDLLALSQDPKNPGILLGDNLCVAKRSRVEKIRVKGRPAPVEKIVEETDLGPVIAVEGKVVYVKNRGWKGKVVESYAAWFASNFAPTLADWVALSDGMALSINWLGADRAGNIAYTYCGLGKSRKSFGDDRLPVRRPTDFPYPDFRLAGFNPPTGFFANWNSPPVRGFRNGDLATGWGADQRTAFLAATLEKNRTRLSPEFFREFDRSIAFTDLRAWFFRDELVGLIEPDRLTAHQRKALDTLVRWNGQRTDRNGAGRFDHPGAGLFDRFWNDVCARLFGGPLGPFAWMVGSDATWTQTSLLSRALQKRTAYDYLAGAEPGAVVTEVFQKTVESLASDGQPLPLLPSPRTEFLAVNHAGVPTQTAPASFTPFMNRGSDVQIVHLTPGGIRIWGVMPPGNDACGPHALDQLAEFQAFRFRERPLTLDQVARGTRHTAVLKP